LYYTYTERDHSSIQFIRINGCKVDSVLKVIFRSKQTEEFSMVADGEERELIMNKMEDEM
jgi:hypothetical protein